MFKILIVDDEIDILEVLIEEFQFNRFEVKSALSGNEAVEILKKEKFDIVLSDFRMPNGTGMEILKFISSLVDPPVFFFVSGYPDISTKECIMAGAHGFFDKPFNVEQLVADVTKRFKEIKS